MRRFAAPQINADWLGKTLGLCYGLLTIAGAPAAAGAPATVTAAQPPAAAAATAGWCWSQLEARVAAPCATFAEMYRSAADGGCVSSGGAPLAAAIGTANGGGGGGGRCDELTAHRRYAVSLLTSVLQSYRGVLLATPVLLPRPKQPPPGGAFNTLLHDCPDHITLLSCCRSLLPVFLSGFQATGCSYTADGVQYLWLLKPAAGWQLPFAAAVAGASFKQHQYPNQSTFTADHT